MTLNEALRRVNDARKLPPRADRIFLACGFEPLHFATFLRANASCRFPEESVDVVTGQYGDLSGNLRKAIDSRATTVAAVVEWDDLDPRLGLRSSGGWAGTLQRDIQMTCRDRLAALGESIARLASRCVVALSGPTLPLAPLGHTARGQATPFELELHYQTAGFLRQMAEHNGVRVLDPLWLENMTPAEKRLDAKMALIAGFPYTTGHADALARGLIDLLYPSPAKKGLIVDLDDTLWSGIVGEVGVDGVSWCMESKTQVHALLQQMLAALAENGVLIAVASKNDPAIVEQALSRRDLLLPRDVLFPVVASWNAKSAAVAEILRVWNIGADAVVMLDDSPMELSEVQTAHPGISALQFRPRDAAAVWELLGQLRNLFGKPVVLAEDAVRASSIRAGAAFQAANRNEDFLQTVAGRITLDYRKDPGDKRVLELVNKTNQFNLNGVRIADGEWLAFLDAPDSISAIVSYEDKFGPLGKIAAVFAVRDGCELRVRSWVMSCRAFSRKIEHHTLESLFRVFGAERVRFDFKTTERNQPLREFFEAIGLDTSITGEAVLSREDFAHLGLRLPHEVNEISA